MLFGRRVTSPIEWVSKMGKRRKKEEKGVEEGNSGLACTNTVIALIILKLSTTLSTSITGIRSTACISCTCQWVSSPSSSELQPTGDYIQWGTAKCHSYLYTITSRNGGTSAFQDAVDHQERYRDSVILQAIFLWDRYLWLILKAETWLSWLANQWPSGIPAELFMVSTLRSSANPIDDCARSSVIHIPQWSQSCLVGQNPDLANSYVTCSPYSHGFHRLFQPIVCIGVALPGKTL